uniref:Uncharacterized protein n=1 Tax=Oryza minuta TaxID=63629 RepID=A0A1V1H1X0_ORYMI|nr:hypothetical protein [Oryza minuta]
MAADLGGRLKGKTERASRRSCWLSTHRLRWSESTATTAQAAEALGLQVPIELQFGSVNGDEEHSPVTVADGGFTATARSERSPGCFMREESQRSSPEKKNMRMEPGGRSWGRNADLRVYGTLAQFLCSAGSWDREEDSGAAARSDLVGVDRMTMMSGQRRFGALGDTAAFRCHR